MARPYKRELEYLESTGTQYIDSRWYLQRNSNTFEISTSFIPSSTQNRTYCGVCGVNASNGGGSKNYCTVQLRASYTNSINCKNGDSDNPATFTYNGKFNVVAQYNGAGKTIWTVNGSAQNKQDTLTYLPAASLYIFGIRFSPDISGSSAFNIAAKLYYYAIKENGVLVRDFIPVLDNNDTPCMYDRVSKQLFYNQGTGEFLYGEKPEQAEIYSPIPYKMNPFGISLFPYRRKLVYLESTGTQFIDSLWHLSSISNTFELEMSFTPSATQIRLWCCMCGLNCSSGGGTKQYYLVALTSNTITGITTVNDDSGRSAVFSDLTAPFSVKMSYNGSQSTVTTVNGTASTAASALQKLPSSNLYIFGLNYNPAFSGQHQNISAKLFSFSIKENGVLVRNFIPVLDNNEVPCLFDQVDEQFYYNQGTGKFLYA